ncbi:MAG: right-handed parallel beta-helix repeat-containing protein [Planctomycetes bacterium]|nr:right-handed parallel beta-helix repeat-containing protein [Planctomycetota bacterium]
MTIVILMIFAPANAQDAPAPLVVTKDTKLTDKVLHSGIVIAADGVTLDGGGATIAGPGNSKDKNTFLGDGIFAKGRKNVTIKNINVRGFRRGVHLEHCEEFNFENCDASDNYTDPSFGWGDFERVGGFIFDYVNNSKITKCKAGNNWNGLDLYRSNLNMIVRLDASHCSNVCLKMDSACDNLVGDCNLSYGIRIDPGETHARDSTSVLLENGSDRNTFTHNDITHGGDGVFIRVLNGWMSQGNIFKENDCSYANNNGFESWSQGNSYIRNKANYCSFGFWLGGSDKTVLEENEAGWNGLEKFHHNAPEPDFIHGGIVIVGGTGSHTMIEHNYCHDNRGAGIVFRGDLGTKGAKWKMHHVVVQRNRLENNKWGIFARFCDSIWLLDNQFKNNEKDKLIEDISNLTESDASAGGAAPPVVKLVPTGGPLVLRAGEAAVLDASGSADPAGAPLKFFWSILGSDWIPKVNYSSASIKHIFMDPGFYRIGVTVSNGALASIAWLDCYVLPPGEETGTEFDASAWRPNTLPAGSNVQIRLSKTAVFGEHSIHLKAEPFAGGALGVRFAPAGALFPNLADIKKIALWIKYENENIGGFGGPNPTVTIEGAGSSLLFTPIVNGVPRNLLMDLDAPETRDGWVPVVVDLGGGAKWSKLDTYEGEAPAYYNSGLEFKSIETPADARDATSLVATKKSLYCAVRDGAKLYKSGDGGEKWKEVAGPAGPGWNASAWSTQCMSFDAARGKLYLRIDVAGEKGAVRPTLAAYDITKDEWSLTPTFISITHGATVSGHYLYGISHARMGNFGGGICRIAIDNYKKLEDRTMLTFAGVPDPDWYGIPAQLLAINNKIYGIKNDWTTPRPQDMTKIGDRLFEFDADQFKPSIFAGGEPDNTKNWRESRTPTQDLGPLPFEPGRGASLAALPPRWCSAIGAKGGIFIIAGCSPSNHEGDGVPSNLFAIYDMDTKQFTTGELPGPAGAGSSVAFFDNAIVIKRGGLGLERPDREVWIVRSLTKEKYDSARAAAETRKFDITKARALSIQFESAGGRPVSVWIDGLQFLK